MIALGMCVLNIEHKILGHYIVRNVTEFQNCRSKNNLFIGEKTLQKHFDKNTSYSR